MRTEPVTRAPVPWCSPSRAKAAVLLPEPDSPTIPSAPPGGEREGEAVHGAYGAVARRGEGDGQAVDRDQGFARHRRATLRSATA
ncbi:hypothetical protein GCM10020000_27780 [Streptomyces olivoverticillatus]